MFRVGSRVRQTPEEGQWTYRPKRCGNDDKDEDNRPKTHNDKNHQASSKKFWQLTTKYLQNLGFCEKKKMKCPANTPDLNPIEILCGFQLWWVY